MTSGIPASQPQQDGSAALRRWHELTHGLSVGRASGKPLHTQISDVVVGLIERGDISAGERLRLANMYAILSLLTLAASVGYWKLIGAL